MSKEKYLVVWGSGDTSLCKNKKELKDLTHKETEYYQVYKIVNIGEYNE